MSGHNNWVTFDYEKRIFGMNTKDFLHRSKQESIDLAVEKILEKYNNLHVSLSGGLDSEFVAKCLLERGVKFTPVIVDYVSNANEVWYAYYWCYKNNIAPVVIKLTKQDLISKFPAISVKHNTAFISAVDFIVEDYVSKKGGNLITSAAEPFARISSINDKVNNPTSDILYFSTYDFMLDYHMPDKHAYNFLLYIPDLFYDMVKHLDYTKPVQLAMSEYYGLSPRPKINAASNVCHYGQEVLSLMSSVNSKSALLSIGIGNQKQVLNKFENHDTIVGIF